MPCIDENVALRYVEGLLSPDAERDVEAHVAGCEECRWLLNAAGGAVREQPLSGLATQRVGAPSAIADAERDPTAQRIGEVLAGSYVIERLIGRGGMGTVYEGSHRRLPRRFAIKILSASLGDDAVAVERIRREAEVTSRLSHPHIVEVVDFNTAADGTPFIVMELLEGESLASRIRARGPFTELGEVREIARQVSSALGAAHREGVIHRDLTPSNIFLCSKSDTQPFVKVMDFGLAKERPVAPAAGRGQRKQLTLIYDVLGTPAFMPPEQASGGAASVDLRADVYSFAATLYAMLCGGPPPTPTGAPALARLSGTARGDEDRWEQIPQAVRAAVTRAMSVDPAARHASMGEIWQELAPALAPRSPDAVAGATPRPPAGSGSRWPLLAGAIAALAAAAIAAFALLGGRSAPSPRPDARAAATAPRPDLRARAAPPMRDARAVAPRSPDARAVLTWSRPVPSPPRQRSKAAPAPGALVVQTRSAADGRSLWADVFLDGKRVGESALVLEQLPAGSYRVEVRRAGYETRARVVKVEPGRRARLLLTLRRSAR